MDKGFVYYVLTGRCRKYPTNTDSSKGVKNMEVVVRFNNESIAEYEQLGNGFYNVREEFQAGLPFGWAMDDYGIECLTKISEEEANKRGFIIV